MFEEATTQLRRIQLRCEQTPEFKETIAARDSVRQHYQSTFSLDRIPQLMAGDFREFLRFKNNKHWTNLHRQGGWICQDMDGLRRGLLALHNHSHPIEVRWDLARSAAKHLGPATLSAILHILYPRECGIWNGTSQASLQRLNIWPQVSKHASSGGVLQANQ